MEKRLSKKEAEKVSSKIKEIKKEVQKAVIGQEYVIDAVLRGILCDGHILVEGVPGIAKTLLVRCIAIAIGGDSKRVQFTVDLLPTDITGLTKYVPKKGFKVSKGPVFTNLLLSDEINRSPPKTQSALLQAMQEKEVTIGKKTYVLPKPFFVMATENPLETSGVYPLPEAQIDRFLFKILMGYPNKEEDKIIMEENLTTKSLEDFNIKEVTNPPEIKEMQEKVKRIYLSPKIKDYIAEITYRTRENNSAWSEYVQCGASPRSSIGMYLAGKARALMQGRNYVIPQDIKDIAHDVLRHRIILNYSAHAEGISTDNIITKIINRVPLP